ncbi:hypothetical protein [Sediminicoccus sp. KRV36]|uniref:hypothetical protein n=1 Tax=Sediminicoccus sp. KRV36 TaxID=3133721 RepID=UPI00200DE847|nr:hypothetical protein [Sediminicoccus rosea]UPY38639.1 hypothetical protein LHU95_08070 [Sediminicoccus rosea]
MRKLILACLLVAGCAAGDGTSSPQATAPTGDPSFDGRYTGTVLSISPPVCGQPGGRIVMTVANGGLSMRLGGGRNLLTARVNPGGSISDVTFSGPVWVGSSSGSGQVTDGEVTLRLSTSDPSFSVPCAYQYTARKAA